MSDTTTPPVATDPPVTTPPITEKPATPARRSRLRAAIPWLAALITAVITVLALVGLPWLWPTPTYTVSGEVVIHGYPDSDRQDWPIDVRFDLDNLNPGGDLCDGGTHFQDLHGDTPVTVYDRAGDAVASGVLRIGETDNVSSDKCYFAFSVENVPQGGEPYTVQVSDRGRTPLLGDRPNVDGKWFVRVDYKGGRTTPAEGAGGW